MNSEKESTLSVSKTNKVQNSSHTDVQTKEDFLIRNKPRLSRSFKNFFICPLQAVRISPRLNFISMVTWDLRVTFRDLQVLREIAWQFHLTEGKPVSMYNNTSARREALTRAWKTRDLYSISSLESPPFWFTSQHLIFPYYYKLSQF